MPDDLSTMRSRYYDPWARTAWLLAVSRALGADLAYADRGAFVAGLEEHGVTADLSRVSRWESGQHQVSFRALRGYERVLGLPTGSLVGANRQLVRGSDQGSARPERVQFKERSERAPDALAAELIDRATSSGDPMTGGEWLQLATELEHFPLVLLPSRHWSILCDRLVNELARTSAVDQLRRFEALTTLLNHPVAQRHVLQSIGSWLLDEHVQVVSPMLSLLQHLSDPAASGLVLKLLESDSNTLSQGAVQVAAAKLARGHFPEQAAQAILEQTAVRALLAPSTRRGVDLLDLTAHLPDDAFARVHATVKDARLAQRLEQTREASDLATREVSNSVSRQIATQAQALTPSAYSSEPDQLLQRLVREALFHVSGSRRQMAAHLLGLSPYGAAVADCCISLAGTDRDVLGDRAWEAVWLMGRNTRRSDLGSLAASDHPWTQRRALVSLARSPLPLSEAEQDACGGAVASQHQGVRRAALYAAGLQAPHHLPSTRHSPQPEATWWHRVGPALRDRDSHVTRGANAS
jgi:hypothetical protein